MADGVLRPDDGMGHPYVTVTVHDTALRPRITLAERADQIAGRVELPDHPFAECRIPDIAGVRVDAEAIATVAVARPGTPVGTAQRARRVPPQKRLGRPDHAVGVDQATVAAVTDRPLGANDRAGVAVDELECPAVDAAYPNVVVLVHRDVAHVESDGLGKVDDALVLSVSRARAGPRPDVVQARRGLDHAVAVAVLALPVLFQADMHDAAAVAVADPHTAVLVHGRAGRVALERLLRRRPVLSDNVAGVSIDLDHRVLRRNRDPDEPERRGRVVQLHLVAARHYVDSGTFIEVAGQRVRRRATGKVGGVGAPHHESQQSQNTYNRREPHRNGKPRRVSKKVCEHGPSLNFFGCYADADWSIPLTGGCIVRLHIAYPSITHSG